MHNDVSKMTLYCTLFAQFKLLVAHVPFFFNSYCTPRCKLKVGFIVSFSFCERLGMQFRHVQGIDLVIINNKVGINNSMCNYSSAECVFQSCTYFSSVEKRNVGRDSYAFVFT